MLNKLCNGIETKNGKLLCAVLTTVGGLHMALTESEPAGDVAPTAPVKST